MSAKKQQKKNNTQNNQLKSRKRRPLPSPPLDNLRLTTGRVAGLCGGSCAAVNLSVTGKLTGTTSTAPKPSQCPLVHLQGATLCRRRKKRSCRGGSVLRRTSRLDTVQMLILQCIKDSTTKKKQKTRSYLCVCIGVLYGRRWVNNLVYNLVYE